MQVTALGRKENWPLHRRVAELGGLPAQRAVEVTFYLPDGRKATSNGQLFKQIAGYARDAGSLIANASEARALPHIHRTQARAADPSTPFDATHP